MCRCLLRFNHETAHFATSGRHECLRQSANVAARPRRQRALREPVRAGSTARGRTGNFARETRALSPPGAWKDTMKLALATALAALPFLLAAPAQAQNRHGQVAARGLGGGLRPACGCGRRQCALLQNVVAEDRPEVGLSVLALEDGRRQGANPARAGAARHSPAQRAGALCRRQGHRPAQFVRCFEDGCYAEVILEDTLRDTLSTGKSATFIVFQTPEEGIGIPSISPAFAKASTRSLERRVTRRCRLPICAGHNVGQRSVRWLLP